MELKIFKRLIETPLEPVGAAFEHIELVFRIPRYYEGMDLSQGTIYMIATKDGSTQQYYLEKADYEEEILAKWAGTFESSGTVSISLKISNMESEIYKSYPITIQVSEPARATFSLRSASMFSPSSRIAVADEEDPITISERTIIVPPELQNIAVQNDENSEEVTIVIPRYFDGNDLDSYTAILKTVSRGGRDDLPLTKITTSDTELTFSWVLCPPQTSYSGELKLQIRFVGDGFKWETDATSVNIIVSQDADPVVPTTPTIIDGLINQVSGYAGQAQQSAAEAQQSAETASQKADEIMGSIDSAATSASAAASSASAAAESASGAKASADRAEAAAAQAEQIAGGDFVTHSEFNSHVSDGQAHVSEAERIAWNSKAAGNHNHNEAYDPLGSADAVQENLNAHARDGSIHHQIHQYSVTLTAVGWNSSTKQQTVSVTGVTDTYPVIVSYPPGSANKANKEALMDAEVEAISQAAGTVTFECGTIPSSDLTVLVEVIT